MYYYNINGATLVSLTPLEGFGPQVEPAQCWRLYAAVPGDPVLGRGSFKVNHPGQLLAGHGLEVLDAAEEAGDFDLYVLDVVMPGLSGIQLGMRLREVGSVSPIIYLTVSPEYAVDSYATRAFHYLMKPVQPETLFQVLDEAVAALEKKRPASPSKAGRACGGCAWTKSSTPSWRSEWCATIFPAGTAWRA